MTHDPASFAEAWPDDTTAFDWPAQADWLPELRQHALGRFREHGLPGRQVERWKYTRLDGLDQRMPVATKPVSGAVDKPAPLAEAAARVVISDGGQPVVGGELCDGVQLYALEQALSGGDHELRELLEGLDISGSASAMAALNTASLRHGLVLRVDANVDAGDMLVQWVASEAGSGSLANARICIILEAGASLNLVEQFESAGEVLSQANVVIQARLGPGARLNHVRVVQESDQAILVTATDVDQSAGSQYRYTGLDLGGGTVRHDVRARLREEGAFCSLSGASLTRGRNHVDNHLDAEHHAMNCSSRQYYRAVLGDRSRTVFNGRVFVAAGADGTDAEQSSAALLLSPLAEIDSKPELEIYADEVVASHGATVGQLDENQLFYLRSRGLDRASARTLLTTAFCRSVVEQLPNERLRGQLEARLEESLRAIGIHDA